MDQNAKQQVVERLKQATNVLVTVRSNPTVDQLAACIGMTLMLNKLKKHATAVFSGNVPSTIEFLQPEDTIEHSPDSLRDFIISLDKSKADKLRYKVEEDVVRIFITPYKTSISENDLDFSQGDFNVDVVIALGVLKREDLDRAITEHGRILHDATVITVTNGAELSTLGAINWQENTASSLCEMLVSISEAFEPNLLDTQMATAFLTGIVAETDRFSNAKTSSKIMTMSAQLMAAGANQQLIANKLQDVHDIRNAEPASGKDQKGGKGGDKAADAGKKTDDGELDIDHEKEDDENQDAKPPSEEQKGDEIKEVTTEPNVDDALDFTMHDDEEGEDEDEDNPKISNIHIDEHGTPHFLDRPEDTPVGLDAQNTSGQLTANTQEETLDPSTDTMSLPPISDTMLSHKEKVISRDEDTEKEKLEDKTLTDIEEKVHSPHVISGTPENEPIVPEQIFDPTNSNNTQPDSQAGQPQPDKSPDEQAPAAGPVQPIAAPPEPPMQPQTPPLLGQDTSSMPQTDSTLPPPVDDATQQQVTDGQPQAGQLQSVPPDPAWIPPPFVTEAPSAPPLPVTDEALPQDGQQPPAPEVDDARDAVTDAIGASPDNRLEPLMSVGSQPLGSSLHDASIPVPEPPATVAGPPAPGFDQLVTEQSPFGQTPAGIDQPQTDFGPPATPAAPFGQPQDMGMGQPTGMGQPPADAPAPFAPTPQPFAPPALDGVWQPPPDSPQQDTAPPLPPTPEPPITTPGQAPTAPLPDPMSVFPSSSLDNDQATPPAGAGGFPAQPPMPGQPVTGMPASPPLENPMPMNPTPLPPLGYTPPPPAQPAFEQPEDPDAPPPVPPPMTLPPAQ